MNNEYDPSVMTYTIPVSGHYNISSIVIKYTPTGNKVLVDNDDKKWYEFWKPQLVEIDEFIKTEELTGSEIRVFKKDDQVQLEIPNLGKKVITRIGL